MIESAMRKLHCWVGWLALIGFISTGVWMKWWLPPRYQADISARFLLRANHVYLLLAAMVNLALGLYLVVARTPWRTRLQAVGSVLLLSSAPALIVAYLVEPPQASLHRPITTVGIFSLFVGVILHVLAKQRV